MALRRTRFGTGVDPDAFENRTRRVPIDPVAGFDGSRRATDLDPGFSPEMKNFAIDEGRLKPRSGISQFAGGTSGLTQPVLGGGEFFDENGNFYGLIASDATFSVLESDDPSSWATMDVSGAGSFSGTSTDFWESTLIYDDDRETNIAVFTQDNDLPKFVDLNTGNRTVSEFTNTASVLSKAQTVAAMDNRLIWGNVEENNNRRVSRVVWSQRGKPQSYDNLGTEAGFEDLFEMEGEVLTMVRHRDRLWILGSQEIWSARPRRDTFAFNFVANIRNIGAPLPRTAAATPAGVVFLAQDLELYAISGGSVQPLGPAEQGGESRIQSFLQDDIEKANRAFAFYDQTKRSYNLYYVTSEEAAEWPTRSLTYDFETNVFTKHEHPNELTHGFGMADPKRIEGSAVWDRQGTKTWDEYESTWDSFGVTTPGVEARNATVFSSLATAYRFRDNQFTDDGQGIDARWRSHGLRGEQSPRRSFLQRVELEYEADAESRVTVATSLDGFSSDLDTQAASVESSMLSYANIPVTISGRAPQFEIRASGDGPEISRIWAEVRSQGRF